MKIEETRNFIALVENAIQPAEVGSLFFFQNFKKLVPRRLFKSLLLRASRKNPYIGFMIEPYSLFMFFKLKDTEKAQSMLPERYRLRKTRIFADEEPDYYYGLGALNTRASTFCGARLESYLIAEDTETGLLSFIFIDILSNTLIALPPQGIADPNCRSAILANTPHGEMLMDFREDKTERRITAVAEISKGKRRELDQSLWLTGNTSIAHSTALADGEDDPFAVIFDPAEVEQALEIPLENVRIEANTLFPDLAEYEPCKAVCFPFAQHYIADSPGCRTIIRDRDHLVEIYRQMASRKELKTFSSGSLKKLIFAGTLISSLISISILMLLVLHW